MTLIARDAQGMSSAVFWGEISPCEHLVQIYQDDGGFLDSLEGFVEGGLRSGDGVVVIATREHLNALEKRLRGGSMDLRAATEREQYIALEADEVLAKFMIKDWLDDGLFEQVVTGLLKRAGKGGRRVRAFGEMVALMWKSGHAGATVRMEHLWHRLCHEKGFSLFCAYPKIGFTQDAEAAIKEICAAHSKYILG